MDTNVDNRNRRYPLCKTPALLKVQQRVADGYLLSTRRPAGFPLATCFPLRLREPRTESDPQETSKRFGGKKVSGEPGGQRPSASLAAYDVAETVRTLFLKVLGEVEQLVPDFSKTRQRGCGFL